MQTSDKQSGAQFVTKQADLRRDWGRDYFKGAEKRTAASSQKQSQILRGQNFTQPKNSILRKKISSNDTPQNIMRRLHTCTTGSIKVCSRKGNMIPDAKGYQKKILKKTKEQKR